MTSIPFDPPQLLTARRCTGFVDIPEARNAVEESWNGRASFSAGNGSSDDISSPDSKAVSLAGPTHLKREKTMAGNIIVFEPDGEPPQAFWLQRKIDKPSYGDIRLGYKLRRHSQPDFKDSSQAWELDLDEAGEPFLVRILIMHSSVLDMKNDNPEVQSPLDNLSALQMIAQANNTSEAHVVGADLLGACPSFLYAVLPYYPDGTLMQYCMNEGNLKEPVARFFFKQMLKGLKSLQNAGLCHRNLSLDAVKLHGDHIAIDRLDWSMRFNKNDPIDEDKTAPIPGGSCPQFVAPEYFGSLTVGWDGFAADLWASGLMLYSMVVSSEALFMAPVQEDKTFVELCVKGNVTDCVKKFVNSTKRDEIVLSDELVVLLETMLQADPKKRYSLDEVMDHPWVKSEAVMASSVWEQMKTQTSS